MRSKLVIVGVMAFLGACVGNAADLEYRQTISINSPNPTVDDIDACSARILNSGGIVALPRFDMPGVGSQAYFLDPDRNVFGIFQPLKA